MVANGRAGVRSYEQVVLTHKICMCSCSILYAAYFYSEALRRIEILKLQHCEASLLQRTRDTHRSVHVLTRRDASAKLFFCFHIFCETVSGLKKYILLTFFLRFLAEIKISLSYIYSAVPS